MASPARFCGLLAAFAPSTRFQSLFSMSDRELTRRGYDREGLQRAYIVGLGGF